MTQYTHALAFDTETSGMTRTGTDPSEGCQIVSLGACVVTLDTFEIVDSFYVEIKYDERYRWDAGAEKIHGLTREHLAQHGICIEDAAAEFLQFVAKHFGTTRITPLGHRVLFDIQFVNRMLATIDCELWWNRAVIDTASIGLAFIGLDRSDDLFEAVGLPERAEHNSLTDIVYTIEALKVLKEHFMRGLANDS